MKTFTTNHTLSFLLFGVIAIAGLLASACGASSGGEGSASEQVSLFPSAAPAGDDGAQEDSGQIGSDPVDFGPVDSGQTDFAPDGFGPTDSSQDVGQLPDPVQDIEPRVSKTGFNPDLSCFEQASISEQQAVGVALSVLDQVSAAFPELSQPAAKSVAASFGLCEVNMDDVTDVLQQGELGRQFHQLTMAVASPRYFDFVEVYKDLPCLLAGSDYGVPIVTDADLVRLVHAVNEAALIQLQPTNDEIEEIARNLAADFFESMDDALNDEPADESYEPGPPEDITCEQFLENVETAASLRELGLEI